MNKKVVFNYDVVLLDEAGYIVHSIHAKKFRTVEKLADLWVRHCKRKYAKVSTPCVKVRMRRTTDNENYLQKLYLFKDNKCNLVVRHQVKDTLTQLGKMWEKLGNGRTYQIQAKIKPARAEKLHSNAA